MELLEIFTNGDAQIVLDEFDKYIQVTWLKHPGSESYRHILQLALSTVLSKDLNLWLCDMRQIAFVELADQDWQVQTIFTVLDPTKVHEYAYVVNAESQELLDTSRIHNLVEQDPQLRNKLHIEIFFEKDIARQWLLDNTKSIIRFNVE